MIHSLGKQGILTLVAVGLLAGCGPRGAKEPQQRPNVEVSVVRVQAQRVVLTTELPGRIVAYRVSDIRPQVNGIILKRAFEEGSLVKEGDLLYQIDPAQYQAAYKYAKVSVALAEATLPAVRAREERYKNLVESHAVGQQDYDDALAALRQTEGQLEVSKAALEMAEINLSHSPIKAPISGRIGRSSVTEGALVVAYQPVPLATVQQLDPIFVDVPQSTADMLRLKRRLEDDRFKTDGDAQNKVTIIREDGSVYPLEGTLEFRDITVNATTGSVILRVVVPNPDNELLPGMFVRAVLKEGTLEQAILVPQAGVSRNSKGEPMALVVDASGKSATRMIKIDRAMSDKWLISEGLAVGDQVIVEGVQKARPGTPVTVVESEAEKKDKCPTDKPSAVTAKPE